MLSAMAEGASMLLTWPNFGFVVIGVLIGVVFGAIPGLGGTIALALLLPVTFGMTSEYAIILFAATLGGVMFGGSISAILLNVPGTAPNAATLLDGHPMAQQGRAEEALGASAAASALGAVFGIVVLIALIPVAREIILMFGPTEFFWLAVLGLTIIASVTDSTLTKGLISGGLGLTLSLIGFGGLTGEYRFGFGTDYLWDGVELIPMIIGLFAVAEMLKLIRRRDGIATTADGLVTGRRGVIVGIKQVLSRPGLFVRSSVIGVLIGMIPGAGGTVANFFSYMTAMQSSKDPDSFGKGNIEGVIASEAANDSKDGGALLPTIVFGLPGSAPMVVLLGALTLHGVNPGQQALGDGLPLLFLLLFSLVASNLLTSLLGCLFAKEISTVTRVPVRTIIPAVLVVSLAGAFAMRNNYLDLYLVLVFGVVGYLFIVFDYSRIALVLGFILGPIAERGFIQTLMIHDDNYWEFFTGPISIALILLVVVSLLLPVLRRQQQLRGEASV